MWERDDIAESRWLVGMPFGLLLPGPPGAAGQAALNNDGAEIEVIGSVPLFTTSDNGVIYSSEGGRVMRLEVQTSP